MYFAYILRNIHNRLYVGHTDNLQRRLKDHSDGAHGAKFIKDYGGFTLVYTETFGTRAETMKREKQLKGWTRAKKEALIKGDMDLLKKL
jgi:predicted GIY-YIG superfamily endonuclease